MGHLKEHLTLIQPKYFSKPVLCPFGSTTPHVSFDLLQPGLWNLYDYLQTTLTSPRKCCSHRESHPFLQITCSPPAVFIHEHTGDFHATSWELLFLQRPWAVQQQQPGLCDTLSSVLSPPAPTWLPRDFSQLLCGGQQESPRSRGVCNQPVALRRCRGGDSPVCSPNPPTGCLAA